VFDAVVESVAREARRLSFGAVAERKISSVPAPAFESGCVVGAVVMRATVCLIASVVWLPANAVASVPICAAVSFSLSASSNLSCASPEAGLLWVAALRGTETKLFSAVVFTVPDSTRPMSVCAD